MHGWQDFRRAASVTTALSQVHEHQHAAPERHHHDRGDANVLALDGGHADGHADDGGAPGAGSVPHVLAAGGDRPIDAAITAPFAWVALAPTSVSRWLAHPLERPPRG